MLRIKYKVGFTQGLSALDSEVTAHVDELREELQDRRRITHQRGSGLAPVADVSFVYYHTPSHRSSPIGFANDPEASLEEIRKKRDRNKRWNSIFGAAENKRDAAKLSSGLHQALTIALVARKTFPIIVLKSFQLDRIFFFIDEFEEVSSRYPSHNLSITDFCSIHKIKMLTIMAGELKYLGSDMFFGGLSKIGDSVLKTCIYDLVKEKSADDFITKISSVRFLLPEREHDFLDALNFPVLFDRGLLYTHKFTRVIHLIGQRA